MIIAYPNFYQKYADKMKAIRNHFQKPLTLTEKILLVHQIGVKGDEVPFETNLTPWGKYLEFVPDRVAMQDATAQMAILQCLSANCEKPNLPVSVHLDHLIKAKSGEKEDLANANKINAEVYDFLRTASARFGFDFWPAGSGIIHQIVLENYAFPGGLLIGTDSHTPTAGGLGMMAVGVGGADAVDAMVGLGWELKFPKVIGVLLKYTRGGGASPGILNSWINAKDIILKILGQLTVKGGTGYVLEYFGEGVKSLSATGRATITNMGAELGATSSIFPYDEITEEYLKVVGRDEVNQAAKIVKQDLTADPEVYQNPEKYFDQIIEIDLDKLEPYLNGPFTPDAAHPISEFKKAIKINNYPNNLTAGLIGSCTNSSYEDFVKSADILKQAKDKRISLKMPLYISLGSARLKDTLEKEGILDIFKSMGAIILANACGPCIGQWERTDFTKGPNSILISFNRNFAKRNDGNPETFAFITSPEIITAKAFSNELDFNPLTDYLVNDLGEKVKFELPKIKAVLPKKLSDNKDVVSVFNSQIQVNIKSDSERLALLQPFQAWEGTDLTNLKLLIKVKGKCTTDHISMAGPWLKYRGHLDKIADNLLIGAVNDFNCQTNSVLNSISQEYEEVPKLARFYQNQGFGSIVVAEENYGEGSSREHAAMEPRYLGVRAIIVKSFARIHETNLKKQGVLALTFKNKDNYDKIQENDTFEILGLTDFQPHKNLILKIKHESGKVEEIELTHSYEVKQINWFKAGSALNCLGDRHKAKGTRH